MQTAAHELAHTTIATWVLAVERALQVAGVEPAALMREVGVDPQLIRDPERRITVANMWKLWRAAVEKTGDDAFGLRVAEHLFPTHLNALLFALQASTTLRESVQRLQRYARVVTTIAEIRVDEGADLVRVVLDADCSSSPERPYQPVDAFMAIVVKTFRDLLGERAGDALLEIQLQRPQPNNLARFVAFFDRPLRFGCAENALLIRREAMDVQLPGANSAIALMNDQLLNEYLSRMNKEQVGLWVRREIIAQLGSDEVSQERVADKLNMSSRNLHRKLAEEGVSFKALLDQIRRDLALRYLSVSAMSLNEVTYSLGFIDQSSFSRAFKRWTGKTPGQYRREMKKQPYRDQ